MCEAAPIKHQASGGGGASPSIHLDIYTRVVECGDEKVTSPAELEIRVTLGGDELKRSTSQALPRLPHAVARRLVVSVVRALVGVCRAGASAVSIIQAILGIQSRRI